VKILMPFICLNERNKIQLNTGVRTYGPRLNYLKLWQAVIELNGTIMKLLYGLKSVRSGSSKVDYKKHIVLYIWRSSPRKFLIQWSVVT
jgi:hypothetical protein